MRIQAFLFSALTVLGALPARAELVDHSTIKALIESRFQLRHQEIGMMTTSIPSKDCAIEVIDESPTGLTDESALQISKDGKVLKFIVSEKMSYDRVLGSLVDLSETVKSGLVTHSTLLKISPTNLLITQLALYPNDANADETFSITCHF